MAVDSWEALLVGVLVALLLIWFAPGVKASVKESPKATGQDWKGVMLPLAFVVLFVMLLVALA